MADFQHKESDREFRHRLEELLPRPRRGDACAGEEADEVGPGGGEGVDQIARRRRRLDLEGDDLAETSTAARRHDRILSRWAARQAEEIIINNIVFPGSGSPSSPRSEWLGERERERVRLVREWMQTVSQQRDARASSREEQERGESVSSREGRQQGPTRRNLLRIRGRQARHDLVMRNVRERERELQELSELRPVNFTFLSS